MPFLLSCSRRNAWRDESQARSVASLPDLAVEVEAVSARLIGLQVVDDKTVYDSCTNTVWHLPYYLVDSSGVLPHAQRLHFSMLDRDDE